MSLAEIEALKEGDEILLGPNIVDNMRLETVDGRYLMSARLGQLNGMRAVRLAEFDHTPAGVSRIGEVQANAADLIDVSEKTIENALPSEPDQPPDTQPGPADEMPAAADAQAAPEPAKEEVAAEQSPAPTAPSES